MRISGRLSAVERALLQVICQQPGLAPVQVRELALGPRLRGQQPYLHNSALHTLRKRGLVQPHDWNRPGCWPTAAGLACLEREASA